MTRKQIDIYEELYKIAKQQYYSEKIDKDEYFETIHLIRKKAKEIQNGFNRLDYFSKGFDKPELEINVKETINFVLSMN